MSAISFIPALLKKDPELALILLEYETTFINLLAEITDEEEEKPKKRKRSVWVRPYLKRRSKLGHYDNLMQELALEDPILYKNFLRIDEDLFNEIVKRVTPILQRKTT